jgi:small-conductance mechanosensitive channel
MTWPETVSDLWGSTIFRLGTVEISLASLVYMALAVGMLLVATQWIRRRIVANLLSRTNLDLGARHAVGMIFQYAAVLLGFLVILQTAGIDVTSLNVLAGALGIGLGFGLQNVVGNFISGLIILIERPVKVGDRIEVGAVEGDVIEVRARSTTVLTNDNISIIIPNSRLITENVVNWSYNDQKVRFRVPIQVAYGSDARHVEQLLLDVAEQNPDVLKQPAPGVRLMSFEDNGLLFELRVWSTTLMHRKGLLISALNFGILEKLGEHGVRIPSPQREVKILRRTETGSAND